MGLRERTLSGAMLERVSARTVERRVRAVDGRGVPPPRARLRRPRRRTPVRALGRTLERRARRRRSRGRVPPAPHTLAALTIALVAAPAAHASELAPGLSRTDMRSIVTLAGTHWPKLSCKGLSVYTMPGARMKGLRAAPALGRSCTVLLNRDVRLTATGWCRALERVFARMNRGRASSAWPYDCTIAVGPTPATPKLLTVPGVTPERDPAGL